MASTDPHETDPTLLKDHSTFRSFKTSRFDYPRIRVFYRQHAKAEELPKSPGPLPLLVCVPGLGGSVAQFHPLLCSLVDLAPCLSMDWPGGGRSEFAPADWKAYTSEALAELVETVIEEYRDKEAGQTVVLIGHSMGTGICAGLANKNIAHATQLADYVVGLLAICPVSGPRDERTTAWARRLMWIPGWVVDLLRGWDGMGGLESPSVSRFLGEGADASSRLLQYRYNRQSRTPVWRRMLYGMQPLHQGGKPVGGIPGLDVWAGIEAPVYLVAGEKDHLTPPSEVDKIVAAMKRDEDPSEIDETNEPTHKAVVDAAAPVQTSPDLMNHIPKNRHTPGRQTRNLDPIVTSEDTLTSSGDHNESYSKVSDEDSHKDPSTPPESPADVPLQPRHTRRVVKSIVMPAPATHALLYMPSTVRALAGLIADFLSNNVTGRLSLGWQLQYLSREGKWDVKNLNKWKGVVPVSDEIGPAGKPIFRAMKTLREVDEDHSPSDFVAKWGGVIRDVVDISKDQPVYDPQGLERAGVHYHKFPTVSKVPPLPHEVEAFIQLIDSLREEQKERAAREGWDRPAVGEAQEVSKGSDSSSGGSAAGGSLIGVHCHYGFNRTGYFVVCYLVERCGFGVQEAVEAFARARPNGIRHSHFLDRLYVRYNVEAATATS